MDIVVTTTQEKDLCVVVNNFLMMFIKRDGLGATVFGEDPGAQMAKG